MKTFTEVEISEAFEKVYRKRREHRHDCCLWDNEKRCIRCGYGLQFFYDDILEVLKSNKKIK